MTQQKTIRMKRQHATAWLAALRSGEYKQGRGRLARTVHGQLRYCCLGVLEMVVSGEVEDCALLPSRDWLNANGIEFFYKGRRKVASGNYSTTATPWIPQENKALDSLNDNDCYTFAQLADLIESNIEFTDDEEQTA